MAQLFEEFKERSRTDPSAAKPRAPGKEVSAVKLAGPAADGAAVPPNAPPQGRGGKAKWTCSCCKNLVSFVCKAFFVWSF